MKLIETAVSGAYLIELKRVADERGFFARSWCATEFASAGLDTTVVQCNISFNRLAGTLRGMHYQVAPHEETKLVRCTRGAIFDVVADVRADSPSYLRWAAFELNEDNMHMLYMPKGVAHGFQTLVPETEVFYQMGEYHTPDAARGFRWDDPTFAVDWPLPPVMISERDRAFPFFSA